MLTHPDCQPEAMALLVIAFIASKGRRPTCPVSPSAQMVEAILGNGGSVGQHCDSRYHSLVVSASPLSRAPETSEHRQIVHEIGRAIFRKALENRPTGP